MGLGGSLFPGFVARVMNTTDAQKAKDFDAIMDWMREKISQLTSDDTTPDAVLVARMVNEMEDLHRKYVPEEYYDGE